MGVSRRSRRVSKRRRSRRKRGSRRSRKQRVYRSAKRNRRESTESIESTTSEYILWLTSTTSDEETRLQAHQLRVLESGQNPSFELNDERYVGKMDHDGEMVHVYRDEKHTGVYRARIPEVRLVFEVSQVEGDDESRIENEFFIVINDFTYESPDHGIRWNDGQQIDVGNTYITSIQLEEIPPHKLNFQSVVKYESHVYECITWNGSDQTVIRKAVNEALDRIKHEVYEHKTGQNSPSVS